MKYQLFFNTTIIERKTIIVNIVHTFRLLQVLTIIESINSLLLKFPHCF